MFDIWIHLVFFLPLPLDKSVGFHYLISFLFLFHLDIPGLSNPGAVLELQAQLMEALRVQIEGNHRVNAGGLINTLFNRIQDLRHIGAMHRDFVAGCAQRWPDLCASLPALYSEMMDIAMV